MSTAWHKQLQDGIIKQYKKSSAFLTKYEHAFPPSYRDEYSAEIAVSDITYLELL